MCCKTSLKSHLLENLCTLSQLKTTKLNHLLTMFTQKFYQFYFARKIVYGEESSKSS